MNVKAQAIRARQSNPALEPPRDDTIDADKNAKIFQELQALSAKKGLQTYLVTCQGEPVCTIVFKVGEAQVTAIVTKLVNGRRVMWKSHARGYGYDKFTASLAGLQLNPIRYISRDTTYPDFTSPKFELEDKSERWDTQLLNAGFHVWRTL